MGLAGTAWLVKSRTTILSTGTTYQLNYYIDGVRSTIISTGYTSNCGYTIVLGGFYISIFADFGSHHYYGSSRQDYVCPSEPSYMEGTPFIMYVEGGIDENNPTLMSWLNTNATKLTPYDLRQLNLTAGSHTISVKAKASGYTDSSAVTTTINVYSTSATITNGSITGVPTTAFAGDTFSGVISANNGYAIPTSSTAITVTNGAISSYNSSTGDYTISSVTGNLTISCTCLEMLDTPANVSLNDGEISFDSVNNADGYRIYSDSILLGTVIEE